MKNSEKLIRVQSDACPTWLLKNEVNVEVLCGTINRAGAEGYTLEIEWMNH